jgi:hypothetical protein
MTPGLSERDYKIITSGLSILTVLPYGLYTYTARRSSIRTKNEGGHEGQGLGRSCDRAVVVTTASVAAPAPAAPHTINEEDRQ